MKRKLHYGRTIRQIKCLGKQIVRLKDEGKTPGFLELRIDKLKRKIFSLPSMGLRKLAMTGSVLIALSLASLDLKAQEFAPLVVDPFGMTNPQSLDYYAPRCQLVDIDGDSDMDLFTGDYNISGLRYQENTGDPTNPAFGMDEVNPFGLDIISFGQNPDEQYLDPCFGDLDNDGDFDLILLMGDTISGNPGYWLYVENTGSSNSPSFTNEIANPFGLGLSMIDDEMQPSLADINGDGLLDLFVSVINGNTDETECLFYENIGSSTNPNFMAPILNPFGLNNLGIEAAGHVLTDLDCDGDYDLLLTGYDSLAYYQNTGSMTTPSFSAMPNTLNLSYTDISAWDYLAGADLDCDGDVDILMGDYDYGQYIYWEHINASPNCPNDCITGINEGLIEDRVLVSPNPFNDFLNIELVDPAHKDELIIKDLSGREVSRINPNGRSIVNWDTADLPSGVYLITTNDRLMRPVKVVKQ